MLFCVLQELQGGCFTQFLYYPGLSQQCNCLESATCSELYIPDIPLCGWLGSKHQLTNSKLSEWVLQSCFKLPRTKVLDQASGLEETKKKEKKKEKRLDHGFWIEHSPCVLFTQGALCPMSCVCTQVPAGWSVGGDRSAGSVFDDPPLYIHTHFVYCTNRAQLHDTLCVCVWVQQHCVWNQNLGNSEWCFLQKSRSTFALNADSLS